MSLAALSAYDDDDDGNGEEQAELQGILCGCQVVVGGRLGADEQLPYPPNPGMNEKFTPPRA